MKVETVYKSDITANNRLDSSFYLSSGATADRIIKDYIKSGEYICLGDKELANVWQPGRSIIAYAGENEEYVPYLQPYDILEYMPTERSRLSAHQNDIDSLRVEKGTILQTCSGRNLGPLVISDKYLEKFVFGSDLIRIKIYDEEIKYYVYAFFSTWIGQALLHSNKTGSVIDHLSIKDIMKIKIPMINKSQRNHIAGLIKKSHECIATARERLDDLKNGFIEKSKVVYNKSYLRNGWTVAFHDLSGTSRIDAAYYDPDALEATIQLKKNGGVELEKVADVIKPAGRYKTNYVRKEYGKPLISGRQLLQHRIVGLKYLPDNEQNTFEKFKLREGYIAYPADGRVEGRLGTPVMITKNRNGWYASGHIGRIIAHKGVKNGYLYLALTHPVVQAQLSALACGSVVDAVYPEDVKKIILPFCIDFPYDEVERAWYLFDEAEKLEIKACDELLLIIHKRGHGFAN
ncbi:MAG: restriction endonuclease subunit S [Lachnospiraceae bacterium]|nr:restriction endonuclease subunit S [Lachnospiraceae bacterium]